MSSSVPQYRVCYTLKDDGDKAYVYECFDGPFDYRGNAIAHRNSFFDREPEVSSCWIEKEGEQTGAVLLR